MTTPFTDQEILDFRKDTVGCNNVIHMNSAGASLMPDPVTRSIVQHVNLEASFGGYEASAMKDSAIKEFYKSAAVLFNCKPTNIAFTANATDSFTRALSSIPFKESDVILTSNDDYISNQIHYLSLQKRFGIKVVRVKSCPSGGIDLDELDYQLKTLKPRLLALTHIPTNSGLIQPVKEIACIVRKYETLYLLDACQSVGQLNLDVAELQCDFLSVTSRKFLRGPRGAGFLYVSDKALNLGLEPLFLDMRGAEWVEKDVYIPRADASRFEDWEFAYALLLGTKTAIDYALAIGLDRIWQRVHLLSKTMRSEISKIGAVRTLDKGSQLGALVTFTASIGEPTFIVNELLKRNINVVPSYRNFAVIDFDEKDVAWAIRVSPHYFNTLEEVQVTARAIDEILSKVSGGKHNRSPLL